MALRLDFATVPDREGFGKELLLKGDFLFVKISRGSCVGVGEATHNGDDRHCMAVASSLFERCVRDMKLDLEGIRDLERGEFSAAPDFLTATAISAINQALYDLLGRENGVPVWRLFREQAQAASVPVYVTINRALRTRDIDDYRAVLSMVEDRGFRDFKCAPFERVNREGDQVAQAQDGLNTLRIIRSEFPQLDLRIDFHKRFHPESFFRILPEIDQLGPVWIEEPFEIGPRYIELKERTRSKVAGGELFFGTEGFRPIVEGRWADVIMPDVKHVGGLGPLLEVCALADERGIEVSPHNPSGPIATMASLHGAAVCSNVTSLELALSRESDGGKLGQLVEGGRLFLTDGPGWGIDLTDFA